MEEYLNPLALTHVLQYTLRSLCSQDNNSHHQWNYAVFWRILPRNYPPPKLDTHEGAYDRSKSSNKRNWILVWEDGFCNFGSSPSTAQIMNKNYDNDHDQYMSSSFAKYGDSPNQSLQPEIFFKMSHEIYNFGEGLIGKVAADRGHKWIYKEASDNQDINLLSTWHHSPDAQPRTWEAQFQSGIKTIALIAVREGVLQLGSMHKVAKDLSYVVLLRKKFAYIESIPGVLLPHPSSSSAFHSSSRPTHEWDYRPMTLDHMAQTVNYNGYEDQFNQAHQQPLVISTSITPSMTSLEALLSKLPSVVAGPAHQGPSGYCGTEAHQLDRLASPTKAIMGQRVEEEENNIYQHASSGYYNGREVGSSMSTYHEQNFSYHYQDLDFASCLPRTGFL